MWYQLKPGELHTMLCTETNCVTDVIFKWLEGAAGVQAVRLEWQKPIGLPQAGAGGGQRALKLKSGPEPGSGRCGGRGATLAIHLSQRFAIRVSQIVVS